MHELPKSLRVGRDSRKLRTWGSLALMLALFVLSACQPIQPATLATVAETSNAVPAVIDINEEGLTVPSTVPPGLTSVQFSNSGQAPHVIEVLWMADGATADQIFRMPPLGDPNVGGMINVMFLEPGASVETVLDFSGHSHYLATEVFVDEPGFAEIAVGDGPVIEPPVANVTVELVDFAYVMPDQIKAGPTWWSLSNNSAQSHDLGIYKLEGDLTVEMVMAQLDAGDVDANLPPPVTSVPSAAVGMGQAYWMKYDLTPGNYVALCRVPDFSTMPPGPDHRHMGMVHEFTVAP